MRKEYSTIGRNIKRLFTTYGGFKAFIFSPLLHFSIFISIFVFIFHGCNSEWSNVAIACLPSIIGMSLTGYALILTFGNEQFRKSICSQDSNNEQQKKYSLYMSASSSFAYFITIQLITLLSASIIRITGINDCFIVNFFGTIFTFYSFTLVVAAVLNTFFISYLYDKLPK